VLFVHRLGNGRRVGTCQLFDEVVDGGALGIDRRPAALCLAARRHARLDGRNSFTSRSGGQDIKRRDKIEHGLGRGRGRHLLRLRRRRRARVDVLCADCLWLVVRPSLVLVLSVAVSRGRVRGWRVLGCEARNCGGSERWIVGSWCVPEQKGQMRQQRCRANTEGDVEHALAGCESKAEKTDPCMIDSRSMRP